MTRPAFRAALRRRERTPPPCVPPSTACSRSGWFILGPEVEAFEAEFAAACGAAHARRRRHRHRRDRADPARARYRSWRRSHHHAAVGRVHRAGDHDDRRAAGLCRHRSADVSRSTAAAVARAITPRTRAILPVHLYGQAADMEALARSRRAHGLALVEDCCQAHLATATGRPVGTIGVAGAFSFYPTKNLGALGDGGAVVTNDLRRWPSACGACATAARPIAITTRLPGVNSRLDEMQAAILRARLPFLAVGPRRARSPRAIGARSAAAPSECCAERDRRSRLPPVRGALGQPRPRCSSICANRGIETLVHYPDSDSAQAGRTPPASGRVSDGGRGLRRSAVAADVSCARRRRRRRRRQPSVCCLSRGITNARADHRRRRFHRLALVGGTARRRPSGPHPRQPVDRIDRQHRPPEGPLGVQLSHRHR